MSVANEQQFLLELLHQYWGTNNDMPYAPAFWLDREVQTVAELPAISVILRPSTYRQHGFSGRYLSYKKEFSVIICLLSTMAYLKSEWEDEVVRILKTYCKVPTTTNFPTAIIDYIHVLNADDDDTYYAEPAITMRRIEIACDIQRNLN